MPLIYSVSGRPESYVEPVAPARGASFERVLEQSLEERGQSGESRVPGLANIAARAYGHGIPGPSQHRIALTASQVMRAPVVSIPPEATITEAEALMKKKRFRHLPVVDAQGAMIGIVSDRDLIRRPRPGEPVSSVMTSKVLSATRSTPIKDLARVMLDGRVSALPVLDETGERLLGILTVTDLLQAIVGSAPVDLWV